MHFNEMTRVTKNASATCRSVSKCEGVPVPLDGDSTPHRWKELEG